MKYNRPLRPQTDVLYKSFLIDKHGAGYRVIDICGKVLAENLFDIQQSQQFIDLHISNIWGKK
jgi:hypothetical protein